MTCVVNVFFPGESCWGEDHQQRRGTLNRRFSWSAILHFFPQAPSVQVVAAPAEKVAQNTAEAAVEKDAEFAVAAHVPSVQGEDGQGEDGQGQGQDGQRAFVIRPSVKHVPVFGVVGGVEGERRMREKRFSWKNKPSCVIRTKRKGKEVFDHRCDNTTYDGWPAARDALLLSGHEFPDLSQVVLVTRGCDNK